MKSITKLKNQARAHEQKENWQAAIEAYRQVLSALDDAETELDLSLYNRIGDLYYRVGQPDRAVHYYSQAAQKYAELGLFNNAIALCNKALRYRPNDVGLFRLLGEYSAEQGFLVEARRWYLQFAERQVQAGKVEEAFAALEEFAALADDPGVRVTLADQFLAHDRATEALQQLERAYKERIARGQTAEASALVDRIRALDPSADLDALAEEGAAAAEATSSPAEDAGLVIETSADAAGFDSADREADEGAAAEQPSGLETRPDESAPPDTDSTVSGLEVGFAGHDAPPAPPPGEGLAGMETFDSPTADTGDEAAAEEGAGSLDEPPGTMPAPPDAPPAVQEEPEGEPSSDVGVDVSSTAAGEEHETAGPALEAEPPAERDPAVGQDFADDEEPEPLPLLDMGGSVASETEAPVAPEETEDVAAAPPEPKPGALTDVEGEADAEPIADAEEAPAEVEAAAREQVEAKAQEEAEEEAQEEARAMPLLDLGESTLLLDTQSGAGAEESDVEAFDLGTFDLTLASGAERQPDAPAPDIDTGAVLARARELVGRELHDQALAELRLLLVPGLDRSVHEAALQVANELARRDPDNFQALQRRVEFASRLGDKQVLANTYADLAASMMRKGAETKAATVYQRVLELDPANEAAREVLGVDTPDGDAYVDLAAFLDQEGSAAGLASAEASAQVEDFAELFSQFKAKVTEDVAVEESGSHYDLGLAFKEMGLIDEAIAEFQTALRGGEERLKVYEELGQCFMLKEHYTVAVKILARALELPSEDPHDLLGVYYHLGMCHEELGDRTAARQAYEKIMVIDPSFSDVPERLSRL